MKNLRTKLKYIGIYSSIFVIGFLIAKFFDFPFFEISKKIDLVSISSIIVTVWLAIVISTVFDKRKSNFRMEKDLVIRRVESIYNIVNKLQVEAITGEIAYTEAASSIKRINTSLKSVYSLINQCQYDIDDTIKDKFQTSLSELRNVLTNTPRIIESEIKKADLPMSVKDGVIYFNRQKISDIESKFDALKDLLLGFQIDINKKQPDANNKYSACRN